MRFYHGTSVRGWIGILKSGSMDSKKMGDKRVSALYSKFKGNYLTTNRKLAEMYAKKVGNGVVIEIEYDPLAPGRKNNFREQQAAGKDYFVEETPLQVDGPDCFIDTKDPLMTKAKMRGDINKTTEEITMSENTERDLRNAWQKLDESLKKEMTAKAYMDNTLGKPAVDAEGNPLPAAIHLPDPDHRKLFKKQPIVKKEAAFAGLSADPKAGGKPAVQVSTTDPKKLTPQQAIQIQKQTDKMKQMNPDWNPAEDSMFEDRNKIESIYEFGGQILDSAEDQGLTLDEKQIADANESIVSALQGEGMSNPQNLDAIIDDAVADAAYQGGDHADGVGGGIMESINRSFELIKMLQENKGPCWKGYQQIGMKDKNGKEVPNCVPVKEKASAWQRKEGKNEEGGLNAKGRASAKKDGHNLKPPVSSKQAKKSPKSAARRKSFCARMKGMKSKMTGSEKKNDPDSRINKSLRKWDC